MNEVQWAPNNKDNNVHLMEVIRELNNTIHAVRELQQSVEMLAKKRTRTQIKESNES